MQKEVGIEVRESSNKKLFIIAGIVAGFLILSLIILIVVKTSEESKAREEKGIIERMAEILGIKKASVSEFDDSDWYSWAKDKHNSRIVDDVLAPPFKIKWVEDISSLIAKDFVYPIYGQLFHKYGRLFYSFGEWGTMRAVYTYNATTGEFLWRGGSIRTGSLGYLSVGYNYVWGGGGHGESYKVNVETGETSYHGTTHPIDTYSNIDETGLYTYGSCPGNDHAAICVSGNEVLFEPLNKPTPKGKINGAFAFPGYDWRSDYISLGNKLNPGSNDLTVMMWFRWDGSFSKDNMLFVKGNQFESYRTLYKARVFRGEVHYSFSPDSGLEWFGGSSFTCSKGEWCHLAITYDHQHQRMYKNGVLVYEREQTGDIGSDDNNFYIGGLDEVRSFNGSIDEFAVFNRALTEQEIQNLYNKEIPSDTPGLQVLFHFDNNSDYGENETFIYDFSGNNNHAVYDGHINHYPRWINLRHGGFRTKAYPSGTGVRNNGAMMGYKPAGQGQIALANGLLYVPDGILWAYNVTNGHVGCPVPAEDRFGNPKGAYQFKSWRSGFPESHELIELTNPIILDDGKTLSLWLYLDNLTQAGLNVFLGEKEKVGYASISANYFKINSAYWMNFEPQEEHWYHVVIKREGNNWELFKNGESLGKKPVSGELIIEIIGAGFYSGDYDLYDYKLSGRLDDIRVYNRLLTSQEIQELYNNQEISSDGLILKLDFNKDMLDSSGNNNHGKCEGGWQQGVWPSLYKLGKVTHFSEAVYNNGIIYAIGRKCLKEHKGENYLGFFERAIWGNATLYAYNATTGEKLYEIEIPDTELPEPELDSFQYAESYTYEVIISGNSAFVSEKKGGPLSFNGWSIHELDLTSKQEVWRKNDARLYFISGDLLFMSLNESIVALNKDTKQQVWKFKNPYLETGQDGNFNYLISANRNLFISESSGKIFALEQGYSEPKITNTETKLPIGEAGIQYGISYEGSYEGDFIIKFQKDYFFKAENGQWPFNWEIVSGRLPAGLTLQNDADSYFGILGGTPEEAGEFNFRVRVTDAQGNYDEKDFSLKILPEAKEFLVTLQDGLDGYDGCQDSYIKGYWEITRGVNYGNEKIIKLSKKIEERGMMKFNIFEREGGPIPDDAMITRAVLTFYKNDTYKNTLLISHLLKNWSELGVTWNKTRNEKLCKTETCLSSENCPDNFYCLDGECISSVCETDADCPVGSSCTDSKCILPSCTTDTECPEKTKCLDDYWNLPGASDIGTDRSEKKIYSVTENCPFYRDCNNERGLYSADITDLAKEYSVGLENNGWIFERNESSNYEMKMFSCDYVNETNGDTSLRPKLTIEYKRFNPDNQAPVVKIYANPAIIPVNTFLLLNASESYDVDGSIIEYEWDVGWDGECTDFNPETPWLCNVSFSSTGTKTITLTVYDDYGYHSSTSIEIKVIVEFSSTTILTTELKEGQVGKQYSDFVYADGGENYVWSYEKELPSGLALNSETGEISGIPTSAGVYNFTIKVDGGSGGEDRKDLVIIIKDESGEHVCGMTNSSCGGTYPDCINCNVDECSGDIFTDYYCEEGSCVALPSDDCSDCSCSCGGYNTEEMLINDNCMDGKDNDCDGKTDELDPGCKIDLSDYVSWWKFDGNANDEAGRNHGSLQGGASFVNDAERGQVLSLDGIDDYVSVPHSTSLVPEKITISAWVNADTIAQSSSYCSEGVFSSKVKDPIYTKSGYGLALKLCQEGVKFVISRRGASNSTFGIQTGKWYHFVGTYNKNEMKVYINGKLSRSRSISMEIPYNTEEVKIGGSKNIFFGTYYEFFDGKIDDVMIYNRTLAEKEVKELYCSQGGTEGCEAECVTDTDCDDGLFCNGQELCEEGNCYAGSYPCQQEEICNEDLDRCEANPCLEITSCTNYASQEDCTNDICKIGNCEWDAEAGVCKETQQFIDEDVNQDGKVDIQDLIIVGQRFGAKNCATENNYCERADISRDSKIDIQDLIKIGLKFGYGKVNP